MIAPFTANLLSSAASIVIEAVDVEATAPFTVNMRSGSSSLKFLYSGSSVGSDEPIASNAFSGALPLGSNNVKSSFFRAEIR